MGVGPQHCPLGLHALWGLRAAGTVGGRPRGGWPATVVRGVWCQALSLPRPPVLWGGQPGFRDPCVPGAVGAGVGTAERKEVRDCLTKIQNRTSPHWTAKYKPDRFQEGDKGSVRVGPHDRRFDKLKRIWQGPYEVRRWVGDDRYEIITNKGRESSGFPILKSDRLKPYVDGVQGRSVPCGYYSERPIPPRYETYIVQQVVDHHFVGRGRGRKFVCLEGVFC